MPIIDAPCYSLAVFTIWQIACVHALTLRAGF